MNDNQTYQTSIPVIELDAKSRGQFISRTYNHLFVAISAFTLLEILLFKAGWAEPIARAMLGTSWLLPLAADCPDPLVRRYEAALIRRHRPLWNCQHNRGQAVA